MKIKQEKYILELLRKFNMENCNYVSTPMEPGLKISKTDTGKGSKELKKTVREMIGSLMFLMLGTRPDISYAVNYVSRFQENATEEILIILKRIFRYLKGTTKMGLILKRGNDESPLKCYVDSDWASDITDRKSVTGSLMKIYGNSVTWVTRKQNIATLSSTEAELVALCSAVQEIAWFRRLLEDFGEKLEATTVFEDNESCIVIAETPANNRRIKHLDIKYHYVADKIKEKIICIKGINTKYQQADILTKALPKISFLKGREMLGIGI